MAKRVDPERELDRLYGDPPDEFVAGRDDLVKLLKADGRKDEAAEVKRLKKPTRPAALVNWLSREHEQELAGLVEVAERMRDPKLGRDGKKLRAAAAAEREAIEGLLATAEQELQERGGPASTLERVGETLRAMVSDPDVEEQAVARRLEREQEASTIGFAMSGGPAPPAKKEEPKRKRESKPKPPDLRKQRAALKDAQREAEAGEGAVDRAEARHAAADQELKDAGAALKEAKAEAREGRSAVKKAERRLEAAEQGR